MPPERGTRSATWDEADVDRLAEHIRSGFLSERRTDRDSEAITRIEVSDRLHQLISRDAPLLPPRLIEELTARLLAEVVGLGPLDALLADCQVTEVMVNGPDEVWV